MSRRQPRRFFPGAAASGARPGSEIRLVGDRDVVVEQMRAVLGADFFGGCPAFENRTRLFEVGSGLRGTGSGRWRKQSDAIRMTGSEIMVGGQERRGNALTVTARVPLSEMFGYATDLRSNTQGRASYTMQFDAYEEVPPNIAEKVVELRGGESKAA